MKTLSRFSLTLLVAALLLVTLGSLNKAVAKSWTWYIDHIQVTAGSPGYADVYIGIRANTSGDIGGIGGFTLYGTMSTAFYDFNVGHNPSRQTNYLTAAKYYSMSLGNPSGTYNWQLTYGFKSVSYYGNGDQVTQAGILVAMIRFYIQNTSGTSSIVMGSPTTTSDDQGNSITLSYDNSNGDAPLPIQMASFAANVVRENQVEVAWRTVSETNNYGFEIYRKRGDASEWAKISFVQGHGTTLAPQSYTYVDAGLSFGKYYYQIKQVDLDGKSQTFPAMAVTVGVVPDRMVLAQNYPNPFNPSTLIEFVVPMSGHATMKVYNVLGQEVATLFDGNAEAGAINTARFNAVNLPSGLYFYTLKSAGQAETRRMLLTK
jgi:archaellin